MSLIEELVHPALDDVLGINDRARSPDGILKSKKGTLVTLDKTDLHELNLINWSLASLDIMEQELQAPLPHLRVAIQLHEMRNLVEQSKRMVSSKDMSEELFLNFVQELDTRYTEVAGKNVLVTHIVSGADIEHTECRGVIDRVTTSEFQQFSGVSLGLFGYPQPGGQATYGLMYTQELPIESIYPIVGKSRIPSALYPDSLSLDRPSSGWKNYTVLTSENPHRHSTTALDMAFKHGLFQKQENACRTIRDYNVCEISTDLPYMQVAAICDVSGVVQDVYAR